MTFLTILQLIVNILIVTILVVIAIACVSFLIFDRRQKQHSVLRNYPVLARVRYFFESIGPELRQYLFLNDNEDKPFSRDQYQHIVLAGKYNARATSFGSELNYDDGFYLNNAMFPKQRTELAIDNDTLISTFVYEIQRESLFSRKETLKTTDISPYYLDEAHYIKIGGNIEHPYFAKRLVGQSGMSFGALGSKAIIALSKGLGRAGTWMNTGEGGLSSYHLAGEADIIFQIGPGLFGVRHHDGSFSKEAFLKKAHHPRIKMFEIKLAQGAKTRGGHIDGQKVTEEVAEIRNVRPYETINSPNRFDFINSPKDLLEWIETLRDLSQKPIGFKIVVGNPDDVKKLVMTMIELDIFPDFITVDGGEGGTGSTFQELQDGVGLPLFTALPIVDGLLKANGIRHKVKIFASGKLVTPDKVAIALALGADLVNIARGMMISVGCIMSRQCHKNTCPVGVATTDPKKEWALVVEEKEYRVTNYITSLHEGLFNIAAAVGVSSPTEIGPEHVTIKNKSGTIQSIHDYQLKLIQS
ncbi:FMN-binding glutamate synthase family protein [Staphylococcus hyicus]|uniref:FMN-binding glutamate synthase family protein n=1 Tax=Staphylococcus hyicus TaxID=1284 RepID=UPI00211C8273|nr:FMN-binding glutamate synthase family protein [Staphylococcus hyicus]MCQ9292259.1 FMN-binding glutamate synthase family protein [Staphylococcus hyicus]MCQ9307500.1 FMN-binding glutamate synthase family protein [Staphylococcus hyicus]MCQ9309913.1 FMN-binding glutamate synthase family protein [Staphylococcus hyicus]MCQ9312335.1 FMN-binding glutamate synthase family protein [Staphylococcus hyicus]